VAQYGESGLQAIDGRGHDVVGLAYPLRGAIIGGNRDFPFVPTSIRGPPGIPSHCLMKPRPLAVDPKRFGPIPGEKGLYLFRLSLLGKPLWGNNIMQQLAWGEDVGVAGVERQRAPGITRPVGSPTNAARRCPSTTATRNWRSYSCAVPRLDGTTTEVCQIRFPKPSKRRIARGCSHAYYARLRVTAETVSRASS
jgi:hypothetical protein